MTPPEPWVVTLDQHNNPVSNIEVKFKVEEPSRPGDNPLPPEFTNAKIVLFGEEQKRDTATVLTGSGGASVLIKLGDVDATAYRVTASWDDPKLGLFEEKLVRTAKTCARMLNWPVGERLELLHRQDGLDLPRGRLASRARRIALARKSYL